MSTFISSLASSFPAEKILKFIARAYPELGMKINTAQAYGRSAEDILKYLSKMNEGNFSPAKKTSSSNPYLQAQELTKNVHPLGKTLMRAASIGLGAYGLARGLPAIANSKIGQGILTSIGLNAPSSQTQNTILDPSMQTSGQINMPMQEQQAMQPSTPISQAITVPQTQQSSIDSIDIIKQMGVDQKINNLLKAGNTPDIISGVIDQSLTPSQKKWLDTQVKAGKALPMEQMVQEYVASKPAQRESAKGHIDEMHKKKRFIDELQKQFDETYGKGFELEEEPKDVQLLDISKKPVKGDIVATPQGIVGNLESIKQQEALVKDDAGKLHKLKIKDLQLPDENVGKTVARLLEIPEIDKSGPLNYWAYDEPDNELFIMYHNGETYKYKDVPPDLIQELEKAAISPKTKGENMYGAWSPEDKPEFSQQAGREILSRGATASRLIINHPKYKKPKKGEPPNPFYRKLQRGYDYYIALRGK